MRAASIHLVIYLLLWIFTFSSTSARKVQGKSLIRSNWYNQIIAQSCGASASCSKKGGLCITSEQPCPGRVTNNCLGNDCMCCIPQCPCDDKCKVSRKCTKKGGTCIAADQPCYGTPKSRLCEGIGCKCCISVSPTTPAPTTTPPAPTTTPPAPTTTEQTTAQTTTEQTTAQTTTEQTTALPTTEQTTAQGSTLLTVICNFSTPPPTTTEQTTEEAYSTHISPTHISMWPQEPSTTTTTAPTTTPPAPTTTPPAPTTTPRAPTTTPPEPTTTPAPTTNPPAPTTTPIAPTHITLYPQEPTTTPPAEKCKYSGSCNQKGGTCITANQACDGKLKPRLCKGKDCTCCIPVTTTQAPTTTPPAPTTTPPAPTTTPPAPTTTPPAPTTPPPAPTTTPPAPTTTPPAPTTTPPAPTTTPPAPTTTPPAPTTTPPAPTTSPPAPTTTPPAPTTIPPAPTTTPPAPTTTPPAPTNTPPAPTTTPPAPTTTPPLPNNPPASTTTPPVPTPPVPTTTEQTPDCSYDGVGYSNGDIVYIGCAQLRCENNALVPTFEVNSDCEQCLVYNDPHFRTFDNEQYNWHQRCNFSLVQNTQDDNPDYAVYGDFRDCASKKYKKEMPACVRHTVIMDNQHNTFRFNHLDLTYIIVNGVKQDLFNDSSISQFDNTLVWKNEEHTRILMGDTLYVGIIRGQISIWSQPRLTKSLYGMCRVKGGLSNGHFGSMQRTSRGKATIDIDENFALSWRTLIQENEECLKLRKSPAVADMDLCVGKKRKELREFKEKCTASIVHAAPHLDEDTKDMKIDSCVQDLCVCKDTEACLEDISVMAENDQSIQDHVFTPPPSVECGSQFINLHDECLYFSTGMQQVTWEEAKTECSNMGAELVAPISDDFMKQQKSNFGTFWVGGRYSKSSYKWVKDGKITSGWQAGYPKESTDGSCVAFKFYGSHNKGLVDSPCDESRRYICKQENIR